MFDKNTLIAFVLIALVMIFMPFYQQKFAPKPETPPVQVQAESEVSSNTPPAETAPATSPAHPRNNSAPAPEFTPAESDEKLITIETDLYYLTLSNLGGGTLRQFVFKTFQRFDGEPVRLLKPGAGANLGVAFPVNASDTLSFDDIPFTCSYPFKGMDTLRISTEESLTFSLFDNNGKGLSRRFTFFPDRYEFDMEITLENPGNLVPNMTYTVNWYDGFAFSEKNIQDDLTYSYLNSQIGDELISLQLKDKPQSIRTDGDVAWIGLRSKYFQASIVPRSSSGIAAEIAGRKTSSGRYTESSLYMRIRDYRKHSDSFTVVISPLDKDYLSSLGFGLEHMMNWGWKLIKPISMGILFLLKFLHRFISNYGVVLLIFSVSIKVLLYPLTHKSYESMKKMQEVQPMMNELKEKYGNNSEQLNKEMMKLYKDYGVNPMGGCLPMFLQMPLLYALFIVFRTTIELRGAGFIWWIKDLSSPDVVLTLPFKIPLYGSGVAVLPILMALTMLLQQRLTGSTQSNSQQKAMMYFMPVFFLLIFNNFPSGLNLYYTLFNLLTIVQQRYIINPSVSKKMDSAVPVKSPGKKKRK